MDIALSDKQVLRIVDGKANMILYPELYKYTNLDDMLVPYGACFLLFESKPSYGHWCALLKLNNEEVEFFDPYGTFPDKELEWIPEPFKENSNQDYPYMSRLMIESPYKLSYNEHPFQKHGAGIKTCGRWAAVRILLKDLSLKQFTKLFLQPNGDKMIAELTSWINEE